ncbi:Transketolase [Nocardioides aquaticus]|uniref:Transketolase n=2 Tax=Nocardioides aquaticus TaxID=160826 RepID=A0ABX8EM00_9ACTN|nr:Transketolase [Nocardioides aquaticus]
MHPAVTPPTRQPRHPDIPRERIRVTITKLDWTETDDRAVDTARALAMDSVQRVGNGHPGTAMSLAPAAYLLFQKVMRHNPADPHWPGRDRFVLSCGHSSLTLYIQLYLGGWGLELEDLRSLRTWNSKTPGHPEFGHTAGVETTTGPLGQGIGNAVGMAMAARRERGMLDPNAAEGESPFDHQIYVLASDGDIEEGVSSEASSLAGTQQLGNLTLIYDENKISIEDDTDVALSEDVPARYAAYGWHVQVVDWVNGSGAYTEDVPALHEALRKAEAVTDQPSIIVLRTIIAWPAPNAQNTGTAHGSALGEDEVRATKEVMGMNPDLTFDVAPDVLAHTRSAVERGKDAQREWDAAFQHWTTKKSADVALFERMQTRTLPDGWDADLPVWDADLKGTATRKASGAVINAIAPHVPEMWGGSADLAGSNNTTIEGAPSFIPKSRSTDMWKGDPYAGRVLHFGIREHGMGAILNGIAVHGGTRVFGATFLTFSDYMRPSVRLAALMGLPVTYVWTHDSIGLGEDGPTHQPVEHLAALRAIPGLDVVRPADANETAAAWKTVLEHTDRPAGIVLTRQNVRTFPRDAEGFSDTSNVHRGGYVLRDVDGGEPDVVLIGTGSEVQLAVEASDLLAADGVRARVVSMPCREWFDEQEASYRETVIPPTVKARVSVEAGIKLGWREIVGDHGRSVSIETFGASADYERLYTEYGITARAVADAAHDSITAAG